MNVKGDSYVSYEDFVVVVFDEIENLKYVNECFIVVFEVE